MAAAPGGRWSGVDLAPPNAIFNLKKLYNEDASAVKANLGVGAFRTEEGEPYVLQVVQRAEALYQGKLASGEWNKEYLPIKGNVGMQALARKLAFGEACAADGAGRIASVQAISGTGALRLAGEFLARWGGADTVLYIPDQTWANHAAIFRESQIGDVRKYAYYDPATCSLNFAGLMADLRTEPTGAVFLLQAVAHNPTGVDPTEAQWREIIGVMRARSLFAVFDNAYQGFATGSLERDAFAIREFVSQGLECMVCQSFSKNLGLYNERAGCLHAVCASAEDARKVGSQLELIIRAMYSNPPDHSARLVELVLGTPELRRLWQEEIEYMSGAIATRRQALYAELQRLGTPSNTANGKWNHVVDQIGMFCFTGLTVEQCWILEREHHVYLLKNGRISMAGVCAANVKHVAAAIHDAVTRPAQSKL